MRNLLGRLNARRTGDLFRIAGHWHIPSPPDDRARLVSAVYRVMTDIRSVRMAWTEFDPVMQAIVRAFAVPDTRPLTIDEIAAAIEQDPEPTRAAAVELFFWGVLSRDGDSQELPVGATPALLLPRELHTDFRRLLDERAAGDQSRVPMRSLLESLDDPDLESTAQRWGVRVIPGVTRRREIVAETLKQMGKVRKIDEVCRKLSPRAKRVWDIVHDVAEDGPLPLAEALERAGMPRAGTDARAALIDLETSALVFHTYSNDGNELVFIPQEILHPGAAPTALPLKPMQPIDPDRVEEPVAHDPHALAWDVLTLVREIATRGAPAWVPGEGVSLTWQRQLNSRLWFGGVETPPPGYVGFLQTLARSVGALETMPAPHGAADKGAIRPVLANRIRHWRGLGFSDQTRQLRDAWLASDQWIEGRERQELELWGADWRGLRLRLLEELASIEPDQWLAVPDVARRIAEQRPTIVGATFTAASARGPAAATDPRIDVVAQVVEIELLTAMTWFGLVELSTAKKIGRVLRVTDAGRRAAADRDDVPGSLVEAAGEQVIRIDESGFVTLLQPAPIHIWSLTAFGDAASLRPEPTYQLTPGSVGRALSAGFDLDQIIRYLERQSGGEIPETVVRLLREWTAGYKRVRLRRSVILTLDAGANLGPLQAALGDADLTVETRGNGELLVTLPATGEDDEAAETALLKALRAAGYVGQWVSSLAGR